MAARSHLVPAFIKEGPPRSLLRGEEETQSEAPEEGPRKACLVGKGDAIRSTLRGAPAKPASWGRGVTTERSEA